MGYRVYSIGEFSIETSGVSDTDVLGEIKVFADANDGVCMSDAFLRSPNLITWKVETNGNFGTVDNDIKVFLEDLMSSGAVVTGDVKSSGEDDGDLFGFRAKGAYLVDLVGVITWEEQ